LRGDCVVIDACLFPLALDPSVRYPQVHTTTTTPPPRSQAMPSTDHEEILHDVRGLQQQFVQCHKFLADNTRQMAELLCTAHSRGVLLHEAFELANVGYWLENIDWQTKFLSVVLAFAPKP